MARELRQLVDTANAPIFGIDVHGNVNEWNDKTAEITGFSKEEAMNKPLVSTFIVPNLRKSVQDVMGKALKGTETSNYEIEFRTKTNEICHLLVNAKTRRDAESRIVGVVGVAQDVTDDRKHSEVDSALTLMPEDLPPDARSLVNAMRECTSFMSSIMNNLLDVRKMEEGKMI